MESPFNFPMELAVLKGESVPAKLQVITRASTSRRGGVKVALALVPPASTGVKPVAVHELRLDMN